MEQDRKVEAALFSAGRPVRVQDLARVVGMESAQVRESLTRLVQQYSSDNLALEIIKAGEKYAMQVKAKYAMPAHMLAKTDVPRPLIKTLSLIAYYQPMRQQQLLAMIGESKGHRHVKELKRLGFIAEGRESRYKVLTTTNKFPEYFGISTTDKNQIKKILAEHAGIRK